MSRVGVTPTVFYGFRSRKAVVKHLNKYFNISPSKIGKIKRLNTLKKVPTFQRFSSTVTTKAPRHLVYFKK